MLKYTHLYNHINESLLNINSDSRLHISSGELNVEYLRIFKRAKSIDLPCKILKQAKLRECHARAVLGKLLNPSWKLVIGFALIDDGDIEWVFHSFLINDNDEIIEPTPLKRDKYWGSILTEKQTANMIKRYKPIFKWLPQYKKYKQHIFKE